MVRKTGPRRTFSDRCEPPTPNRPRRARRRSGTGGLFTPAIVALGRRFPLRRPIRLGNVLVHASASVTASLLVAFADALVNAWIRPSRSSLMVSTSNWFLSSLPATTVAYFAIVGFSYALDNAASLRERDRKAAELEAQLREAPLGALRMQLQPHFLFNSLNAVMALVRDQDTAQAVRAMSLLSDVLRATVNAGDAPETTLDQEPISSAATSRSSRFASATVCGSRSMSRSRWATRAFRPSCCSHSLKTRSSMACFASAPATRSRSVLGRRMARSR